MGISMGLMFLKLLIKKKIIGFNGWFTFLKKTWYVNENTNATYDYPSYLPHVTLVDIGEQNILNGKIFLKNYILM